MRNLWCVSRLGRVVATVWLRVLSNRVELRRGPLLRSKVCLTLPSCPLTSPLQRRLNNGRPPTGDNRNG